MRVTTILLRFVCSLSWLVIATAGFAADNVSISGSVAPGSPAQGGTFITARAIDGSNTSYSATRSGNGTTFTISVPKGIYVVQLAQAGYTDPETNSYVGRWGYFSSVGVDARNGSVSNVVIPLAESYAPKYSNKPPVASLISVGAANAKGVATITGAPGAALPLSIITAVNSWTGQYNHAISEPDGSFSLPLFAPQGAALVISQDPTGSMRPYNRTLGASTTLRVPVTGESNGAFAMMASVNYASAGEKDPSKIPTEGLKDAGQIWIGGTVSNRTWSAGQTGQLSGNAILYSQEISGITNITSVTPAADLLLVRVLDKNGNLEHHNPEAMSYVLTPSGFPIERGNSNDAILLGTLSFSALAKASSSTATATWSVNYTVPSDLPDGTYLLSMNFKTGAFNLPSNTLFMSDVFPNLFLFDRYFTYMTAAPLIKVGNVAAGKLTWVLAMNDFSQGSRGIVANEDKDRFAIAPHILTNSEKIILPRTRAKTGTVLRYNLEPFVPLIAAENKGTLSVPTLNFSFPSGQLDVLVETPSGVTQNLGSAPFRQSYVQEAASISGQPLSPNSNKPAGFYALTTLDDRFTTTFSEYGLHKITLSGNIDDVFGNRYTAQGTYNLYIAEPLDLETGVFPSTPFEVGDTFAPTLTVNPGVPADVEIRVRVYPNSSVSQMKETIIRGKANDYGYFQPASGTPLTFTEAGEYRVDYTASYTDSDGVLWMASASWGSVIKTPQSSLVTHGRRGYEASTGNGTQQWFSLTDIPFTNPHVYFPYQNGDVIWMDDPDADTRNIAHQTLLTLQDPNNLITSTLTARVAKIYSWAYGNIGFGFSSRSSTGELPFISTTSTGLSPALAPTAADANWAYFYGGSARPGVRVREMVSEDDTKNSYWRFDDTYNYQLGGGMLGDEPNDFKFQFGGAVYRAPSQDFYYYGAYGSLFVLLPTSDTVGTRTTPPFQGASGGPSGGPLFTLKGKAIDMFYHPLGVRAGSVLEKGDMAAFPGQVGPTLDAKVTLTVTKPDGTNVAISGQANKVGNFYYPASNFVADQVGRYKVQVSVIFDGRTSSGPVEPPYPRGDVLGSDDGSYFFYVVEPKAEPLRFTLAKSSFLAQRSNNTTVPVVSVPLVEPSGLSNVTVHETTYMPGFILQQQTLSSLTYSYDAKTLHDSYPNIDLYDSEGLSGVDTVTMSFLVSGTNASGATEYRAGQVLLQGEQMLAPVHQSDRQEAQLGGVITNTRVPTTAVFRASASNDKGLTTQSSFKVGEWVSVASTIVPQAADVGKSGELFVVVRSQINGANTWTYLGQDGVFHPWPTVSIAQLAPALLDPAMSSEIPVTVFEGRFAAGTHFVYVGYMRGDGSGPLHYNSSALRIDVTP